MNQAAGTSERPPRRGFSALSVAQHLLQQPWFVRVIRPVVGPFNPFSPAFRLDPYPTYHRLRRDRPILRSRLVGGWILTRHADIVAVLQDPRYSVQRTEAKLFQRLQPFRGMDPGFVEAITRNLLMLDPPDHTRLRRLVSRAFTPRVVAALRPRIEALVAEMLDRVAQQPVVDFVAEIASPLPVVVICELLGVPTKDRDRIKAWSDTLAMLLDPLQGEGGLDRLERTYNEVAAYFHALFAERRRTPQDDLISGLVAVNDDGDTLSDAELLSLTVLLLGAGHETTTSLLGNAVRALAAFPDERRRLCEEPHMIDTAVEEFLRYDSPVQLTDRVALEDGEIHGRRVRKGELVGLILGAANRDPAVFAEPDRLDLGRTENPHLAFSQGIHFCLGAALARLEARVTLGAFLARFPRFALVPGPPAHRRSLVLRGVTALPLRPHGD